MNEEMLKSLVELIDESLAEIEELKKSDRFSASEIKIEGPGTGIAGKDSNGSMGKADDEEDDKEDEDKEDDKEDMDKGEGKNSEADPNAGHHVAKGEGAVEKGEGKNSEADPNAGHHVAKAEDKKDDDKEDKEDDKEEKDVEEKMKKSLEESNALIKSYVDQRLSPIESKLEAIMSLVKEVANSPVPSKGASYKHVAPLKKSADEGEPLTKSAVVEKLFELKKSGTRVDSLDITSAELGGQAELTKIAQKYNIK